MDTPTKRHAPAISTGYGMYNGQITANGRAGNTRRQSTSNPAGLAGERRLAGQARQSECSTDQIGDRKRRSSGQLARNSPLSRKVLNELHNRKKSESLTGINEEDLIRAQAGQLLLR